MAVEIRERTAKKHPQRPLSGPAGRRWKATCWRKNGPTGWIVSACLVFTLTGCVSSSTRSTTAHRATQDAPSPIGSSGNLLTRWLPSHRESAAQLARLHQRYGQWQEQLGNLTEARKSYEYVLGENPKSTDAIVGLARLDHLAGRNSQAEQKFLKAIRLSPNNPQVHEAAGEFYASQKLWTKAIAQLNSAMMAAPTESSYRYHLAVALARSGDPATAMPHFVQSVGEAEAHYNIGYILLEQGNRSEAEQHFVKAIALRPDLTQAQTMLTNLRQSQAAQPVASQSRDSRLDFVDFSPQRQATSSASSSIRPASAVVPSITLTPQRPLAGGMVPRRIGDRVFSNSVPQFSADPTSAHRDPTRAHRDPTRRNVPLTPQMEQQQNQLRSR